MMPQPFASPAAPSVHLSTDELGLFVCFAMQVLADLACSLRRVGSEHGLVVVVSPLREPAVGLPSRTLPHTGI